ncbi:MAG TPA: MmgE/PrpD family protein [Geminicoccaceae bacterium]|nr:MmgE/PrpD family protein [Geminicoccaceae bacterium]
MRVEQDLAAFVAGLAVADLPADARRAVARLLWDSSACMLAGLGDPVTDAVRAQIVARGGARKSSLVGHGDKVPAPQAALHNGMLAHWSEWDDTFDPGAVHGGAVIFPTLLAVGEACGTTGERFLCAAAAAFEVSCRIGRMLWHEAHPGWLPTGIAALIGAAAGAAKLAGLDRRGIGHAIGLATTLAGGSRQPILERASAKNAMAGIAALHAATALDLVRAGLHAPQSYLGGAFGLNALLAPHADLGVVTDGLGSSWEVTRISLKPWPACRSTHGGIEMALDLVQSERVEAAAIEGVEIEVSRLMHDLVGGPFAPEPEPRVAAQFSLAYTTALAFAHGQVTLAQFRPERILRDRAVADLAARIVVHAHDGVVFGQRMAVHLANGRRLQRRLDDLKGMPQRPLSDAELSAKLEDAAAGKLPAQAAAQVGRACLNLERDGIAPLLEILRTARAA